MASGTDLSPSGLRFEEGHAVGMLLHFGKVEGGVGLAVVADVGRGMALEEEGHHRRAAEGDAQGVHTKGEGVGVGDTRRTCTRKVEGVDVTERNGYGISWRLMWVVVKGRGKRGEGVASHGVSCGDVCLSVGGPCWLLPPSIVRGSGFG